ncbi:MAG: orotidine-5'-phosphate decarboxylase [Rickettsiales bacterium]|nr:orotidine-5'-phosphate decarboxylase [Rickettsiales bacterium]
MHNPILVAIDTVDLEKARGLARSVAPHVGGIKLGLEFFVANGAQGVNYVAGDMPVFLDLKFHDIPNTVAGAIRATAGINCFMMTVHACGGGDMMRAAKEAALSLPNSPKIVGVTVLTSMDQADLGRVGVDKPVEQQVLDLADLAKDSGLDGIVCSPREISALRARIGSDFTLVTPGIRPSGSAKGDQKRIMTPKDAVDEGSNYLVIGRPIAQNAEPAQAAADIFASISQ